MDTTTINDRFAAAMRHLAKTKWRRRINSLAIEAGISSGYISEICSGKKHPSLAVQEALARAAGHTHDEMIAIGRSILETGHPHYEDAVEPVEKPPPNEMNNQSEVIGMLIAALDGITAELQSVKAEIKQLRMGGQNQNRDVTLGEDVGRRSN